MEDPTVVSLRLPKKFLDNKPADEETGDWLRSILIDGKNIELTSSGLNAEQKQSIKYFNDLFVELFSKGTITDKMMNKKPELLEMAETFGGIVNE